METNSISFADDVLARSRQAPVLVDFWAPWCGPCRAVGPVLEKLAAEAGGRWQLVKVNTDAEQELARRFRIQSIPALRLFEDGTVVAELDGALPEAQLRAWLDEHVPRPERAELDAAAAARARGDLVAARALLEPLLEAQPDLVEARLMLAEISFPADPGKAERLISDLPADGDHQERPAALQRLLAMAGRVDEPGEGEVWQRYIDGIRALLDGQVAAAADAWLDVLARDRALDNDGGRAACVALFCWLGNEHPVTREYRPKLASALF
jgi:putative thioredoxin